MDDVKQVERMCAQLHKEALADVAKGELACVPKWVRDLQHPSDKKE